MVRSYNFINRFPYSFYRNRTRRSILEGDDEAEVAGQEREVYAGMFRYGHLRVDLRMGDLSEDSHHDAEEGDFETIFHTISAQINLASEH
jgi:hypothetical protein